jgi:hypothetical protein
VHIKYFNFEYFLKKKDEFLKLNASNLNNAKYSLNQLNEIDDSLSKEIKK